MIPIPYWIDEPVDYSDILKIKFSITNNKLEHFIVYKDMFSVNLEDPSIIYRDFARPPNDFGIETYYPQYSEDFKLRFQGIPDSTFDDCILLNHTIPINQSKELAICFDIQRKWIMKPVDLSGNLEYYLVMMDNKHTSSCPNCWKVKLTSKLTEKIDSQQKIMSVSDHLTPLKQIQMGKTHDEISCKKGFVLLSNSEGRPICITKTSAQKLIQRGWELEN